MLHDTPTAAIEVAGGVEADALLAAHLRRLFERLGTDLVLDVGARQGDYGQLLRNAGYRGRIVSFEPVRANLRHLEERAGADPSWDVAPMALGAEDTVARINVSPVTHFSSLRGFSELGRQRFPGPATIESVETVEVHRLDTVWPDVVGSGAGSIFLKVDTQGFDLEVLRGAGERLGSVAAVQTECSLHAVYDGAPLMAESLAALASWGFDPTGFFPVAVHLDGRLIEVDCVAMRRP